MIWNIVLLAVIALHAFADAICDSIKDYRVHIALHPFGDFWHASKHISRFALILLWPVAREAWWYDGALVWVTLVLGALLAKWGVWDLTYAQTWTWFRLDESVKITTGSKFIDKLLGFHH